MYRSYRKTQYAILRQAQEQRDTRYAIRNTEYATSRARYPLYVGRIRDDMMLKWERYLILILTESEARPPRVIYACINVLDQSVHPLLL